MVSGAKETISDSAAAYHNAKRRVEEMEAELLRQARKHRKHPKPNFNIIRAVEVVHEDGSRLLFQSAFVVYEAPYYYVFTEHHGSHFYHEEDATVYEFERKPLCWRHGKL